MASTYSPKLRFELIGAGEQAGLWGSTTNKNVGQLIEQAIAGVTTVVLDGLSGNYTLTALDGAPDQSRSAVIKCTYAAVPASGAINLIIPTQTKLYVVRNDCGQNITVKTISQTGGVLLLDGEATLVFCDGTDAIVGLEAAAAGTLPVSQGGTGEDNFGAGGFIKSPGGTGDLTASTTVNASTELSGTVPIARGGTGTSTVPSNGQLLIGNGTGYSVANITQGTGISIVNSAGGITIATAGSAGTVTSVGVSGGSTGLTTSGGPITTSGTITLSGTLAITNGGTGATTDSGARSNLGLGSIATQNANNVNITGGSISGVTLSGLPTLSGSNSFSGSNTFSSTVVVNPSNGSSSTLCIGASSNPSPFWNFFVRGQSTHPAISCEAIGSGGVAIAGLVNGSSPNTWAAWFTGTTSSATLRGDVTWNGSVVVYSGTSDYRLKENVVPLSSAIPKLKTLNPVDYNWIEFPEAGTQSGFLAHEFAEVVPYAVTGKKDDVYPDGKIKPQGIDMTFAVPLLTKALQEAIARIEALEAEVAALKGN